MIDNVNGNYKDQDLCKIRTITTFLSLDKNREDWGKEIEKASLFCIKLTKKFQQQGYIVQTTFTKH